jgi:hypothetical protein
MRRARRRNTIKTARFLAVVDKPILRRGFLLLKYEGGKEKFFRSDP